MDEPQRERRGPSELGSRHRHPAPAHLRARRRGCPGSGCFVTTVAHGSRATSRPGSCSRPCSSPRAWATRSRRGCPAITGLYATVGPLLAYAVFGPSRIMVLGPDSALAPLIAVAVLSKADGDPARAVALASLLALLTGALCIGAGVARAGFITDLLSKPVRVGYMNGIGLTIVVTQLPKLFGFSVSARDLVSGTAAFVRGVARGRDPARGAGHRRRVPRDRPPRPARRATCAGRPRRRRRRDRRGRRARALRAHQRGRPGAPRLSAARDPARAPLRRHGPPRRRRRHRARVVRRHERALAHVRRTPRLPRRREPRAHRARHRQPRRRPACAASRSAAARSRTPVAESAGSRTQLTGIVGALAIVVLLVAAPWLFQSLPTTALAAVVIAAAIRIIDRRGLARVLPRASLRLRPVARGVPRRRAARRAHRASRSPSRWRCSTSSGARGDRTTPSSAARTA